MNAREESRVHRVFVLSILVKGIDAAVEIGAAIVLSLVSADRLSGPVLRWATKELRAHPADLIAGTLRNAAENFSLDAKSFATLYLLTHGLIKLVLVVGLLRDKAWAYPTAIVAILAFIVYQTYRFTFTHSPMLVALTLFDLIVLGLVWHEYRTRRASHAAAAGV